jgi:hypothetical protein
MKHRCRKNLWLGLDPSYKLLQRIFRVFSSLTKIITVNALCFLLFIPPAKIPSGGPISVFHPEAAPFPARAITTFCLSAAGAITSRRFEETNLKTCNSVAVIVTMRNVVRSIRRGRHDPAAEVLQDEKRVETLP